MYLQRGTNFVINILAAYLQRAITIVEGLLLVCLTLRTIIAMLRSRNSVYPLQLIGTVSALESASLA